MDGWNMLPLSGEDASEFDNTLANPEYRRPEEMNPAYTDGQLQVVKLARCAIESDHLRDLQRHLEDSVDWLSQESTGLIHLAVKSRASRCLQHLLSEASQSDVDGYNAKNLTPLYVAVAEGWLEGVRMLLDSKADIQQACGKPDTQPEPAQHGAENAAEICKGQKTVLQLAVKLHSKEILQAILNVARRSNDFEKIVNVQDPASKMTPLLIAVTQKSTPTQSQLKLEIVELLLKNRADVNILDKCGKSVLHWAVMKASLPIVRALFEAQREKVRELAKLRCKGEFEGTPLSLAVYRGDLDVVKYLEKTVKASLRDRSNVAGTAAGISGDDKNCNVLHLASLKSSQEVTDYFTLRLYDHDADLKGLVNEKTEDGCSPLSFAFRKHHINFAHALLASGADISAKRRKGRTDMDVLINHLPSAPKFMSDVLDRSIKKHEKKPHVAVNYTVLMPTCDCSNAGNDSCSMQNSVAELPLGNGRLENRRDVGDDNLAENDGLLASSAREDLEMQHFEQPPQSEAAGVDQQGEHVVVDVPNSHSNDGQPRPESSVQAGNSKAVSHNHFDVLKALLNLGRSLNHMKILEHPLVESYLFLHWKKIRGLFALLLGLNVVFASLLSISAVPAWIEEDHDNSSTNNHNTAGNKFSMDNSDDTDKPSDSDLNSAGHDQQSVIVLNGFVSFFMVLLVTYEVNCLWHYRRPWVYWLETVVKFICFASTFCWLVSGSAIPMFIAIILPWIQVTVLILDVRQCHGCGRLIMHFIKKVLKYKGLVFGLITAIASIYVSVIGYPSIITIDKENYEYHNIFYNNGFSLMILLCNITLVFFLLFLAYALKTFSDNYPHKEKVNLMVHQIEFLEVYEKFLLGAKPCGFRGILYYLYKGTYIAFQVINYYTMKLQLREPFEVVKRNYAVYRYDDKMPSDEVTSNVKKSDKVPKTTMIFPEELHRDIIVKGLENRENIIVLKKAADDAKEKKSIESKEQEKVSDDRERIKNLEITMKQVAVDSNRINHLEAMMKTMMEALNKHVVDDANKIKKLETMEQMLQQLSKSSETESEL